MQRFSCLLLTMSLTLFATSGLMGQENLDQKIVEQQKLADEAHARKAAGEPAITAARAAAN